jgi:hypothetical protein
VICRYFSFVMVTAVDAGDTFPTFIYGLLIAPRVSFCRNAMPMHLASDYIHPYKDAGENRAWCPESSEILLDRSR